MLFKWYHALLLVWVALAVVLGVNFITAGGLLIASGIAMLISAFGAAFAFTSYVNVVVLSQKIDTLGAVDSDFKSLVERVEKR